MKIQATNNYVWIIPDEEASEVGGLLIPDGSKVKPHQGLIQSIGNMVTDKSIKVGKKAIFNKNVGQEITFGGVDYKVLRGGNMDSEILGVI